MEENTQYTSTIIAEEKSTHIVETFILDSLSKHPNADTLSIIKIAGTDYTYVAKTDDWKDKIGKLVAWVPPDSIVDTKRPEFAFLGDKGRIRGKRIRGVDSYGILVLAPDGLKPGDNAAEALGVIHYNPDTEETNVGGGKVSKNSKEFGLAPGEVAPAPKGIYPKYDVDAYLKYAKKVFVPNELVYITEKIHGSSSRFVFQDGQMHCGSRNEWKKEFSTPPKITLEDLIAKMGDEQKAKEVYLRAVVNFKPKKSMWWTLLENYPAIRKFCETHPGWCLYGEVFGNVKNFKYGSTDNKLMFRAFDILVPSNPVSKWMDADEFINTCDKFEIPRVPLLAVMPYNFEETLKLAEGNTTFPGASHIREGCVIKPQKDRWSEYLGRVSLKIINPKFLEIN